MIMDSPPKHTNQVFYTIVRVLSSNNVRCGLQVMNDKVDKDNWSEVVKKVQRFVRIWEFILWDSNMVLTDKSHFR